MSFLDDLFGQSKSKPQSNEATVDCFTYDQMLKYYRKVSKKVPGIAGSTVSVCKESEYRGTMRPQDRWVISLIFCDALGKPLKNPANGQDGYGVIVTANSFDLRFSEFMNGKKQALFTPTAEELKSVAEKDGKSLYQRIMDKLAAKFDRAISPEFTIAMLKNYRTVPNSKVIIALVKKLTDAVGSEHGKAVDLRGLDDMDVIIAEYDEKNDNIIKTELINPDAKIRALLENNNGIVVVED